MKFGLPDTCVEALRKLFSEFSSIQKVIIYGSRAKGNYRPFSDIDLTIVGDDVSKDDYYALDAKIDDLLLPYEIDLSVFKDLKNETLIDHIQRRGLEFYPG